MKRQNDENQMQENFENVQKLQNKQHSKSVVSRKLEASVKQKFFSGVNSDYLAVRKFYDMREESYRQSFKRSDVSRSVKQVKNNEKF